MGDDDRLNSFSDKLIENERVTNHATKCWSQSHALDRVRLSFAEPLEGCAPQPHRITLPDGLLQYLYLGGDSAETTKRRAVCLLKSLRN